jgi:hypothetical protein
VRRADNLTTLVCRLSRNPGALTCRTPVTYGAETWTLTNKIEKNVNDMGEKDIEENIWTNKEKWTVEN